MSYKHSDGGTQEESSSWDDAGTEQLPDQVLPQDDGSADINRDGDHSDNCQNSKCISHYCPTTGTFECYVGEAFDPEKCVCQTKGGCDSDDLVDNCAWPPQCACIDGQCVREPDCPFGIECPNSDPASCERIGGCVLACTVVEECGCPRVMSMHDTSDPVWVLTWSGQCDRWGENCEPCPPTPIPVCRDGQCVPESPELCGCAAGPIDCTDPGRTCEDIAQDMIEFYGENSSCSRFSDCTWVDSYSNFIDDECCGVFLTVGSDIEAWIALEYELRSHDPECTHLLTEECCDLFSGFPSCVNGICRTRTEAIMEEERLLCEETGGEWEEFSCGHNPCGITHMDCFVAIPGCRCTPGQNFYDDIGCQHDDSCLAPECMPYVTIEYALDNLGDYAGESVCVVGYVWAGGVVCCDGTCPENDPCCCCEVGNMSMWTPEIEYPGVELIGPQCYLDDSGPVCGGPLCAMVSGHTYVTCGTIVGLPDWNNWFQYRQDVTHFCPY